MSPETASHTPTSPESKQALLNAFDTVLKTQAQEREAEREAAAAARRRRRFSRPLLLICAVTVLFAGAYLYVERPEWVFPLPPTPESLAVREASLRIGMANAAQHVERYRERAGRLPRTLEEAGARADGFRYLPAETSYRLEADLDGSRLAFESGRSMAVFVGNSFEVIARRPR
jgi:hypothetical protein